MKPFSLGKSKTLTEEVKRENKMNHHTPTQPCKFQMSFGAYKHKEEKLDLRDVELLSYGVSNSRVHLPFTLLVPHLLVL